MVEGLQAQAPLRQHSDNGLRRLSPEIVRSVSRRRRQSLQSVLSEGLRAFGVGIALPNRGIKIARGNSWWELRNAVKKDLACWCLIYTEQKDEHP